MRIRKLIGSLTLREGNELMEPLLKSREDSLTRKEENLYMDRERYQTAYILALVENAQGANGMRLTI